MLSSAVALTSDVQIQPGPTDTTSDISVCPIADFVAATSWDNGVCGAFVCSMAFIHFCLGSCLSDYECPSHP